MIMNNPQALMVIVLDRSIVKMYQLMRIKKSSYGMSHDPRFQYSVSACDMTPMRTQYQQQDPQYRSYYGVGGRGLNYKRL